MQNDNFPPRPDVIQPNWFHVWQATEGDQLRPSRMLRQSQRLGCVSFVPNRVMERIHMLTEGPTAELLTTHAENQGRLGPLLLAHVTLLQLGQECTHSCFKPEMVARCLFRHCLHCSVCLQGFCGDASLRDLQRDLESSQNGPF